MIMPIVDNIILYLSNFSSYSHPFHGSNDPLVRNYSISSHYNPRSLVFFTSHIIPFTLFYLINFVSSLWIDVENALEHLFRISCQHFWLLVLTSHYLFVKLISVSILKRQVTAKHSIKYDSARPDINIYTFVSLSGNHLGSSIARRTAGCL